jgi:hypothetical protein
VTTTDTTHTISLNLAATPGPDNAVVLAGVDVTHLVAGVEMVAAHPSPPQFRLTLRAGIIGRVTAEGLVTVAGTPADAVAALDRQAVADAHDKALSSMSVNPADAMLEAIIGLLQ